MDRLKVVTILISLVSAFVAWLVWYISKRRMIHTFLMDVERRYNSLEIFCAVKTLWDFYRDNDKTKLVEVFAQVYDKDETTFSNIAKEEKMLFLQNTLNYQRRIVTHFYTNLAVLYRCKIFSGKLVYKKWTQDDLEIIPRILAPLDNWMRKKVYTFGRDVKLLDKKSDLLVLYNNSIRYYNSPNQGIRGKLKTIVKLLGGKLKTIVKLLGGKLKTIVKLLNGKISIIIAIFKKRLKNHRS